jgi:hypothetical protein
LAKAEPVACFFATIGLLYRPDPWPPVKVLPVAFLFAVTRADSIFGGDKTGEWLAAFAPATGGGLNSYTPSAMIVRMHILKITGLNKRRM